MRLSGGISTLVVKILPLTHREAAGILTHRFDHRDQSGAYGEASGGSDADATQRRLMAAYRLQ